MTGQASRGELPERYRRQRGHLPASLPLRRFLEDLVALRMACSGET